MRVYKKYSDKFIFLSIMFCFICSFAVSVQADEVISKPESRFDVWEVQVKNNTLLNAIDIENIINPYLGPQRSISDIDEARKALENFYHTSGFQAVFVVLPEQQIDQGIVQLSVVEGKVKKFSVSGARYFSPDLLKSQMSSLGASQAPYWPQMQQDLSQVNQLNNDLLLSPVFRQGKRPGEMNIELKVKDGFPLHGGIELNNRYSSSTSKLRMGINLSYNNLWQRNHSLSFYSQISPENTDEIKVYSFNYFFKLSSSNQMISMHTTHSNSAISIAQSETSIIGKGDTYGVNWIIPFAKYEKSQHSFTLGVDQKNNNELIGVGDTFENIETPLSYSVFSINYAWNRYTDKNVVNFDFGPVFSFRGMSDNNVECKFRLKNNEVNSYSDNEFGCKRYGAKANFSYVKSRVSVKYLLPVGGTIQLTTDGQITDQPLVSNEQFAIGGASSVRGYPESHALGDYGARTSLELQSPNFPSKILYLNKANIIAFIDAAAIYVRQPLSEQDRREGLASFGLGGNLIFAKNFNSTFSIAWPQRVSNNVGVNDWRSHFSVAYDF